MVDQPGARMVLDSKDSWRNLPYALMPAVVGLGLLVYPWFGVLEASMTAPIMVPFGVIWLLIAMCINSYHSELILDPNEGSVVYRTSLWLHSWGNKALRGNVKRVVLKKEGSSHRFVMELEDGEDIQVTTFDYWRSREWSEHVASFLGVDLVDECRDGDSLSPEDLNASLCDQQFELEPPGDAPGKIELVWESERRATITIPPRGIIPTARPRLAFGAIGLVGCLALPVFGWHPALSLTGPVLAAIFWYRPLAQATHRETISVSPRGLLVQITNFGKSRKVSLAANEIRSVSVVKGDDARFEHQEFDWHAVCVESVEGVDAHLQLGSHLPKMKHVEWLQRTLLYVLTKKT